MKIPVEIAWRDYNFAPFLFYLLFGIAVGVHFQSLTAGAVAWLGALVWRDCR